MLIGSLRSAHGDEAASELSTHSLTYDLHNAYEGRLVAIPPEEWTPFATLPLSEFVTHLITLAKQVDLARHQKHRRGPKKPAPEKSPYHNGGHASTAKLMALRMTKK